MGNEASSIYTELRDAIPIPSERRCEGHQGCRTTCGTSLTLASVALMADSILLPAVHCSPTPGSESPLGPPANSISHWGSSTLERWQDSCQCFLQGLSKATDATGTFARLMAHSLGYLAQAMRIPAHQSRRGHLSVSVSGPSSSSCSFLSTSKTSWFLCPFMEEGRSVTSPSSTCFRSSL